MPNHLVIGVYLNAAVPAIPQWLSVVVAIAIVTVLNIIGVVSVAWADLRIIAIQAVFIVVFIVVAVAAVSVSGSVDVMAPLAGDGTAGGMAPGLASAGILCLSFRHRSSTWRRRRLSRRSSPPRSRGRDQALHQRRRGGGETVVAGQRATRAQAAYPGGQFELGATAAHPVDRVVGVQSPQLRRDVVEVGDDPVAGDVDVRGEVRGQGPVASTGQQFGATPDAAIAVQ